MIEKHEKDEIFKKKEIIWGKSFEKHDRQDRTKGERLLQKYRNDQLIDNFRKLKDTFLRDMPSNHITL